MKGESVVTPATVSGIAQALPLLTPEPSNSPPQDDKRTAAANANSALSRDNRQTPVDTVTLSSRSRQTATDVKKEAAKKEEARTVTISDKPGRSAAKVEFVYDLKGELITRYMDTAERLIYQVPSELMLHMKEAELKTDPAVDTKA